MRAATLARRTSRTLLAATYLLAFFAPTPVLSVPATVNVSADNPFVDYSVTLDGQTLFYVTASSGRDCAGFDVTQHVDPYLILFNEAGELARDDDGNFNETGDCYSAKLNLTPPAGTYTLRVTTYQHETGQFEVPTGAIVLGWSQDGYQPPTTTTTTSTTTTSTTSSTTTSTSTTTTTTTSTTSSTTTSTTTVPATTTSTTTTVAPTTTSTTSTTTTTEVPISTTTTSTSTTTTAPPATTTSSTTTQPPTTLLPATTTSTTSTTSTTTTSTTSSTTTSTTSVPPTTSTAAPTTTQAPPTTTELPRLSEALTVAAAIPDEALAAAVVDVIAAEPEEIAVDDVRALVEQPTFDDLEPAQLAAVAAAITDASVESKQVFEDAAADDMFSPALADYTRSDSRIPQGERRTVVAVVAAGSVLAVPRPATMTTSATGAPVRRHQS